MSDIENFNPFIFDPTRHGYNSSTEIGDFNPDEAYEMGVNAVWSRGTADAKSDEARTRELFPGIFDGLDALTIRAAK
jgi:hypothetical protein